MPFLRDAVACLFRSTAVPFKLIIVESESTDGTKEYTNELAKMEQVKVYHTKKKGLTAAINFGIGKSGRDDVYITQDDVIHFRLFGRDWLAEMIEIAKNKETGMITTLGGWGVSGPEYIAGFKWIGTWSCYIPRRTIKEVGLFDTNMGPGDDIDYSYRVSKANLKFRLLNYWVQHHRLTEHGDVDSEAKQRKMAKYFRKKWKLKPQS